MVKDRALVDAVATPGTCQTDHRHSPCEAANQFTLRGREGEARMHRVPSHALRGCRILIEEFIVRQCTLKLARPVHHFSAQRQPDAHGLRIQRISLCHTDVRLVKSSPGPLMHEGACSASDANCRSRRSDRSNRRSRTGSCRSPVGRHSRDHFRAADSNVSAATESAQLSSFNAL